MMKDVGNLDLKLQQASATVLRLGEFVFDSLFKIVALLAVFRMVA